MVTISGSLSFTTFITSSKFPASPTTVNSFSSNMSFIILIEKGESSTITTLVFFIGRRYNFGGISRNLWHERSLF